MNTKNQTKLIIDNPLSYKLLAILCMIYISIMLCKAIMVNKYLGTDHFFILGGALISPFMFIMNDIIAEIYGYKIAKSIVIAGFILLLSFSLVSQLIILAPSPNFFKHQAAYSYVLGPLLLRTTCSEFIAYIVSNVINIRILTKWKILLKGRKFWLRSMGSSVFSEAIYAFLAVFMTEFHLLSFNQMLQVFFASFAIKALFTLAFAFPLNALVSYLKKTSGIDVFDFPKKFSPIAFEQGAEDNQGLS